MGKTTNKKSCDNAQEEKVNAQDLATEMVLLLKDYFCGKFTVNDNSIAMEMDNGQSFQIIVEKR